MSQRLTATSGDIDAKRPRIGDAAAASSAGGETAEAFQERRKQELQARKDADKVKADDGAEKKEKEVGGAKRRVSGVAVGEELKMLAKVIDCCGLI